MTDDEIRALHAQGRLDEWYAAVEAQEAAKRAPAKPEPEYATKAGVNATLMRIGKKFEEAFAPYFKRLASLEKRVAQTPGNVNIEARDVTITGMRALAETFRELNATLSLPIRPVYDASGKLVGAERIEGSLPGPLASSLELVELKARIAALEERASTAYRDQWETRLKALEERPSMSYRGGWAEGEENLPGDVCTHGGSMWYCWEATRDRPGTSDAWQLCVKHGRDR